MSSGISQEIYDKKFKLLVDEVKHDCECDADGNCIGKPQCQNVKKILRHLSNHWQKHKHPDERDQELLNLIDERAMLNCKPFKLPKVFQRIASKLSGGTSTWGGSWRGYDDNEPESEACGAKTTLFGLDGWSWFRAALLSAAALICFVIVTWILFMLFRHGSSGGGGGDNSNLILTQQQSSTVSLPLLPPLSPILPLPPPQHSVQISSNYDGGDGGDGGATSYSSRLAELKNKLYAASSSSTRPRQRPPLEMSRGGLLLDFSTKPESTDSVVNPLPSTSHSKEYPSPDSWFDFDTGLCKRPQGKGEFLSVSGGGRRYQSLV